MPEFDAVEGIAPDGKPCFDTKYSESFWYVNDAREVVRHDPIARNIILPLPFSSRDEVTDAMVVRLREVGEGPLVLVHRAGQWGVFVGHWR